MTLNLENRDEFLLYLANHAANNRFYPFPNEYRIKQRVADQKLGENFTEYTDEEFQLVKNALKRKDPLIMSYVTSPSVNLVIHANKPNFIEYEFKYRNFTEIMRNHKYKKRWYLYHGSPLGNWHSIIRNGIRSMSNSKLMTTGAVYGEGVYMTKDLSLAYSYGNLHRNACVAVIELIEDPAKYISGPHYVVPTSAAFYPRYLFVLSRSFGSQSNILDWYKERREAEIPCKTIEKRIKSEIRKIPPDRLLSELQRDPLSILVNYKNSVANIIFDGFPFTPPIFQWVSGNKDIYEEYEGSYYYVPDWAPQDRIVDLL